MSTYTGKILVADDENDIAQIIKYLLENKGNEVQTCHDGQEVLDRLAEYRPDLLVLDVMMPKLSGYALVKELKKNPEWMGIPILMVSGISKGSDKSDEFWQKGMGVDDYITKPFDPKDLVSRVEVLLRKAREGWLDKERSGELQQMVSSATPGSARIRTSAEAAGDSQVSANVPQQYPEKPEEVVKLFVEAWNSQLFDWEYDYLSKRLAFTTKDEYIQRRRSYYAELNSRAKHTQEVQEITLSKIAGVNAQVDIVRVDTEGASKRVTRESYILVDESGKWKINAVKAG